MKKNTNSLFFVALLLTLITSCQNTPDNLTLLKDTQWRWVKSNRILGNTSTDVLHDSNFYSLDGSCSNDDYYFFNSDMSAGRNTNGTPCPNEDTPILPFKWKLTPNQNGFIWSEEGDGDYIYVIEKLNRDTLILSGSSLDSVQTQPFKMRGSVIIQDIYVRHVKI
jgi:hypothetical protein